MDILEFLKQRGDVGELESVLQILYGAEKIAELEKRGEIEAFTTLGGNKAYRLRRGVERPIESPPVSNPDKSEKRRKMMRLAELYEKEQRGEGTVETIAEIDKLIAELSETRCSEDACFYKAMVEMTKDEGNPISIHCQRVLASPPECTDFRRMRSFAACMAWQIMEQKRIPWAQALHKAWEEAKKCAKQHCS